MKKLFALIALSLCMAAPSFGARCWSFVRSQLRQLTKLPSSQRKTPARQEKQS